MQTSTIPVKRRRRTGSGLTGPHAGAPESDFPKNRWCERHGYFIDLSACEARARARRSCGRCIARWLQLSFPFMES